MRPLHESAHNQFWDHRFLCSLQDAVHPPDPLHLILDLELFYDALAGSVLLDQDIIHLVGCSIDLPQVGVQLPAEKKAGVNAVVVLLQVPFPFHTPWPNAGSFRRQQVGDQIIALAVVRDYSPFYFLLNRFLSVCWLLLESIFHIIDANKKSERRPDWYEVRISQLLEHKYPNVTDINLAALNEYEESRSCPECVFPLMQVNA